MNYPANLHPSALVGDFVSALAVIGSLTGYLPQFAAFVGLAFYALQVWDNKNIVRIRCCLRARWKEKALARASRKVSRLTSELEETRKMVEKLTTKGHN